MKFDGNAVYAVTHDTDGVVAYTSLRIKAEIADIVLREGIRSDDTALRFFVDQDGDFECTSPVNDFVIDLALPTADTRHVVQTTAISLRQRSSAETACSEFFDAIEFDVPRL